MAIIGPSTQQADAEDITEIVQLNPKVVYLDQNDTWNLWDNTLLLTDKNLSNSVTIETVSDTCTDDQQRKYVESLNIE